MSLSAIKAREIARGIQELHAQGRLSARPLSERAYLSRQLKDFLTEYTRTPNGRPRPLPVTVQLELSSLRTLNSTFAFSAGFDDYTSRIAIDAAIDVASHKELIEGLSRWNDASLEERKHLLRGVIYILTHHAKQAGIRFSSDLDFFKEKPFKDLYRVEPRKKIINGKLIADSDDVVLAQNIHMRSHFGQSRKAIWTVAYLVAQRIMRKLAQLQLAGKISEHHPLARDAQMLVHIFRQGLEASQALGSIRRAQPHLEQARQIADVFLREPVRITPTPAR